METAKCPSFVSFSAPWRRRRGPPTRVQMWEIRDTIHLYFTEKNQFQGIAVLIYKNVDEKPF
jgi:hypothetical protein